MNTNIIKHEHSVSMAERNRLYGHKSPVIWLTGLSGSGKSTVAGQLQKELHSLGLNVYILDGDNVRLGLNKDLGFTDEDRNENIRRIAEVANLMSDSGTITITAFISPFREERDRAKEIIGEDNFIEVFVDAPLDVCEHRDPKGLYKKARAGIIPMFTGIDSPYEPPLDPKMVVDTTEYDPEMSAKGICEYLLQNNFMTDGVVDTLDKKRTLAIDFDGVIHKYSLGFQGRTNAYDGPMEGAVEGLKILYNDGYILKIMSSRPKEVIYDWLEEYGISDLITEVTNDKIAAAMYIDDRGYHFRDWETTINEIHERVIV
jgi:adenylyl-sulfate kinase